MLDRIRWLHVSDLHLKQDDAAWAQDVVLRALLSAVVEDVKVRPVNLVFATGDLSYSGSPAEFHQVEEFFEALLGELHLSHDNLFVVPGNHDNDLKIEKYSVVGARAAATTPVATDELIGDAPERDQILLRQHAYRAFVDRFFARSSRLRTSDGLAYIATTPLSRLRVAIVGLNSAWLCQSGLKDRGNVLLGERQVIDAIRAAEHERPHLVIALMHHPTFWLCGFEHQAIEERFRRSCDFVLRGHLHASDVYAHVTGDRRCVFVAAGASFETRTARNSFNYVDLDISEGICTVTEFQFVPSRGAFVQHVTETLPVAFRHLPKINTAMLARAVRKVTPELSSIADYLAALLSGDKSEFLAFDDGRACFLSMDALAERPDDAVPSLTRQFMSLQRLCPFATSESELTSVLAEYKSRILGYGLRMLELARLHEGVDKALATRNEEAGAYSQASTAGASRFTIEMLRDLPRLEDFAMARGIAERHLLDLNPEIQREAKRALALVLARSTTTPERLKAVALLEELSHSEPHDIRDAVSLVAILVDLGRITEATERMREGLARFPDSGRPLTELGMTIVTLTGDRSLRDELLGIHKSGSVKP